MVGKTKAVFAVFVGISVASLIGYGAKKAQKAQPQNTEVKSAEQVAPSEVPSLSVSAPAESAPESTPSAGVPSAEPNSAPSASNQETPSAPSILAAAVTAPSESKIVGYVKLQPSVTTQGADYFVSENEVMAGYQFNPKTELSYTQLVFTHKPGDSDTNLRTNDGWLRLKYAPWWTNDSGTSLSHDVRVFVPTHPGKRDAGMITAVRNYVILSQQLSDSMSLSLYEVPIVHIYNRAGNTVGDAAVANPLLENRVYLGFDVSLMDKKLNMGLMLKEASWMNTSFSGMGNRWSHFVWLSPEVTYSVSDTVTVGLNYETGYYDTSLMTPGLGGFQLSDGMSDGIVRAILQVSL